MMLLYVFTAVLYGSLSLFEWMPAAIARPLSRGVQARPMRTLFKTILPAAALFGHGALLHAAIFRPDAMFFGGALGVSAMLWLCMGMYWIESFFFPLEGFRRFIFPLAGLASLLPLAFEGVQILPYAAASLFKAHFIIANMASGLFVLLALHAVLMLFVEHRLHGSMHPTPIRQQKGPAWIDTWLDSLPALLTLEKLLFRLTGLGWILLSLTLVSGFLFSEQLPERAAFLDQKTFFSLVSWVMFGAILVSRRLYGWRGRTALRWVLAAFGVLLLTYIGSRWVWPESVHETPKNASFKIARTSPQIHI